MFRRLISISAALLFSLAGSTAADDGAKPARLTVEARRDLIRAFTAENAFARRWFPVGAGLKIEDGKVFPGEVEVQRMVAAKNAACRPGDHIQITNVRFTSHNIVFEINGGRGEKWWQRVKIGDPVEQHPSGSEPNDVDSNIHNDARGSNVVLVFKDYVPELTVAQVKQMLLPVLDFNPQSAVEAYEKSLPPKLQEAVKNHRALVGMDREMVVYAKGRPPKRIREREGDVDYEEWIYGQPPQEVEFIRFVQDKVVRIETMPADGQANIRTQPEVDTAGETGAAAEKQEQGEPEDSAPKNPPSLRRAGETSEAPERPSSPPRPVASAPVQVGSQ